MAAAVSTWGVPGRPTLVLLHALGCHRGWWDWLAPQLSQTYYILAPDFRGHGESPRESDYSFGAYGRDVHELVASLGGAPYALVGHSMGGYVSLVAATAGSGKPPEAVIVVDMKTGASEQELADLKVAASRPSRSYASLDEAVSRYRLSPPEHAVPADRLKAVASRSFRQQPDGTWTDRFDRRALAIEALDPLPLVRKLPCPALFVRGANSIVMPKEPAQALAEAAGTRLVEGEGLYHHLPLENPDWLAQQITHHLQRTAEPFRLP